MIIQRSIELPPYQRGFHLITNKIVSALPELANCDAGLLNAFLQHSSASLTINENADPTVRQDFEQFFNRLAPESQSYYTHTYEGPDDIPAHFKSSLLGCSITVPVTNGQLNLGTWQGIYLGEHRDSAGSRRIALTLYC